MSEGNKTVVIYKSKYGSAKRYAEWIAEETKADLFDASNIKADKLTEYDTIIYGGSLYAVGILGLKLIKDNFEKLNDKKIVIFSVGASSETQAAHDAVVKNNFTDEMMAKIHFFMLRGAFDFNKLNTGDKMLMGLMKMRLKSIKAEDMDEDQKGLLDSYDNPVDFVDRGAIEPILRCLKDGQ